MVVARKSRKQTNHRIFEAVGAFAVNSDEKGAVFADMGLQNWTEVVADEDN
jgi:hypothetical protein